MKPMFAFSFMAIGAALLQVASYASAADEQQISPAATTQAAPSDQSSTTTTAKIKAEMANEQLPSMSLINVDTDTSGVVSLTGYALSQQDIDKAVSIARGTPGVTSINNSLTVQANQ